MVSSCRAPKQWCLSKVETINSLENWKQNLLYAQLFRSHPSRWRSKWLKKTEAHPIQGLEADGDPLPLARRFTVRQKVNFLELILGQIADSSYPTKAEFIDCLIIYQNIFKHLKEKMNFIFTNFTPTSNILRAKVIFTP